VSRLPAAVLAMLAVATAGAFFVVQHLKSTTPLITGASAPVPSAFNPRSGVVCQVNGQAVDFKQMKISFYLLHRSDDVDVYMVDQAGQIVATLGSGRHMRKGVRRPDGVFTWDGREDDGRFAPDGVYHVRVDLIHQGRTYVIGPQTGGPPAPVKVETHPPRPVVSSVSPQRIPGSGPTRVVIRYRGNEGHYGIVRIYRTDVPGAPRLVHSFGTPGPGAPAVWDGTIDHRPAPPGVYLIGLDVTDAACNTGHFPRRLPPAPGATRHAGVSVRYITVAAPLAPIAAGASATVRVAALGRPYTWALRAPGSPRALATGTGSGPQFALTVPRGPAAVYALRVRAGANVASAPIIATPARRAPVLVVVPALTWQGVNPVDQTGDGLPDTLLAGRPVRLDRPLVDGLPPDLAAEASMLAELRREHHAVDLTTDIALIQGRGPSLASHHGVILAGSERWVTPLLGQALRRSVASGTTVLVLGPDSLRASVRVAGDSAGYPGSLTAADVFGVRHATTRTGDVSVLTDALGLFSGNATGTFAHFGAFEPITGVAVSDELLSSAGASPTSLGVAAVREGAGNVIEVGLTGFAQALARDRDARALLGAAWSLMTG
jgi:hypothetical protein